LPDKGQQTCHFFYGQVPILDKGAAEQCLADYEKLAQSPTFCDVTEGETPESCKKAFPKNSGSSGSKKPGETCESSSDCAGDATCDTPFSTSGPQSGVCVEFVLAPEGSACIGEKRGNAKSWSGDPANNQIVLCDHDAGLYCGDQKCTKLGQLGEACLGYSGCAEGAYCKSSVCEQKLATGAACPSYSDECNDAAFCAESTQICEPRVADGQSCQNNDECLSDYCDGTTCAKNVGLGGLVLGIFCG
jgi:hypothetical protein